MTYELTGRRKPTKIKKQARGAKRKREDVDVEKLSAAVAALDSTAPVEKFTDLPLSEPTQAGLKHSHFSTLTDIQRQALSTALLGRDILGAARTGSGKTLAFLVPVLENLYRAQCVGPEAGLGAMIIAPTRELAIQIFDVLRAIGRYGHLFAAGLIIGGKSLRDEQEALARMNIVVCTPGRILQHLSQTSSFAFGVDSLRMLVLDEADRIMDMGFQKDVDAIIEYLPPDRQTLLFSATQTKRVSDLARLSLNNPEYIAVHSSADSATPSTLQQNYVLTRLSEKLNTLWFFIQSAKKSKILVFVSSGKQVRYLYEALRKLQPGIPLLHLHGRQKQTARLDVTSRFSTSRAACLFATDIAARGLDFPAVDWVVQMDCPEDSETYIHRVGRTARYQRGGRAVLFLDPAEEEGMLLRLSKARVPIERISVRPSKMQNGGIGHQLAALCFKDPSLKYLGQKAFSSYVRSLYVQKDKEIFDLERYGEGVAKFAEALGLPGAPRIKFVKGDVDDVKRRKNAPRRDVSPVSDVGEDDDQGRHAQEEDVEGSRSEGLSGNVATAPAVRTKYDRMFGRQNQDVLAPHYAAMIADDGNDLNDGSAKQLRSSTNPSTDLNTLNDPDADADDLFTIKTRFVPPPASPSSLPHNLDSATSTNPNLSKPQSGRRAKASLTRAGAAKLASQSLPGGMANLASSLNASNHLVFDSDDEGGEGRPLRSFVTEDDDHSDDDNQDAPLNNGTSTTTTNNKKDSKKRTQKAEEQRRAFLENEKLKMQTADADDRVAERARRRAKKERLRAKERERERGEERFHSNDDNGNSDMVKKRIEAPANQEDDDDDVQGRDAEAPQPYAIPLQEGTPFAELADLFPSPSPPPPPSAAAAAREAALATMAKKTKHSKQARKSRRDLDGGEEVGRDVGGDGVRDGVLGDDVGALERMARGVLG